MLNSCEKEIIATDLTRMTKKSPYFTGKEYCTHNEWDDKQKLSGQP